MTLVIQQFKSSNIEEFKIPDGITSVGRGAFRDCIGFTSITIPDSVTEIKKATFRGCSGLTSITIPDSVTSIGERAFMGCNKLSNIKFKGTKAEWQAISKGENWRSGVPKNCTIHCIDGDIKL